MLDTKLEAVFIQRGSLSHLYETNKLFGTPDQSRQMPIVYPRVNGGYHSIQSTNKSHGLSECLVRCLVRRGALGDTEIMCNHQVMGAHVQQFGKKIAVAEGLSLIEHKHDDSWEFTGDIKTGGTLKDPIIAIRVTASDKSKVPK